MVGAESCAILRGDIPECQVKIATAIKIGVFLVVVILGLLAWFHWKPQPKPDRPPVPAQGQVIPEVQKPVVHGDPILPQPDQHITGVLHITIPPDTLHKSSSDDPALHKPRDIYIYLPVGPQEPPEIRSEMPLQATFSPVVDRWVVFDPRLCIGGSGAIDGVVSPWAGISCMRLWSKVNLGAGIDRSAIGLFCSYEFFREFNVGAMWYTVSLRDNAPRAGIILAYRF